MGAPLCAHCGAPARLTNGREVYPHRKDLRTLRLWVCTPCDARVGCHKKGARTDVGVSDGTMPYGTPANAELRRARSMLHKRLDPLWKEAPKKYRHRARRRAYRVLSRKLGLSREETHIGMFDLDQCRAAWVALEGMTTALVMEEGRFDPARDAETRIEAAP